MNVLSVYGTLKASSNEESNRQHTQSFPFLSQNPIFIRLNLDINLKRAKIGAFHYTVFSHFAYSILEPLHMIHLRNTIRFRFRWRIRIFFRWLDTRYRHFSWQEWFRDAIFVVVSSQTCRRVNRFQKKKSFFQYLFFEGISIALTKLNHNSTQLRDIMYRHIKCRTMPPSSILRQMILQPNIFIHSMEEHPSIFRVYDDIKLVWHKIRIRLHDILNVLGYPSYWGEWRVAMDKTLNVER